MKNNDKTREQLLKDLEKSNAKIAELEKSETERKKPEQALRKSEQELNAIFNGARDGIALLDKTGKILRINKYIVEIGGFTEEEIVGKRFHALKMFPLKSMSKMITVFGKLIKGEEISYEVEVNTKKGEKKIVQFHNSLLKKDGKVEGIIAILSDITERKRAEEKEKEHNKNIELLSETAMQFVEFSHDKDIYKYIGEKLREFAGEESYIIINSIDTEKNILTTRSLTGAGKFLLKTVKLIGQDPVGMTYDSTDEALKYLTDGKLHLYEEGIYGIALKNIPAPICKAIEKLASIEKIYTIGFVKENKLFGTVVIFLQDDPKILKNRDVIETFMKQASLAVQRRQAEEALKESNENFQQVVSNITTVVWKADIGNNGAFENTYTSPVIDEFLELPAGTMKNDWDKYFKYIKPEYLEQVNNAFREAIKSPGKEIDCEYEVLKDNGKTAWFNSKGRCFETNGKLHIFGSTIDITERKKAEKKLRNAEANLKNTFDISPGLICVADANTRYFTECNLAVIRILGISVEEFTSKPFMEFIHPDDKQGTVDEISKQLRGSPVTNFENRYQCKDGSYKWLAWQATAADKNGKVYAVATDITERKQAEETLKESEQRFRSYFEMSLIGMAVTSVEKGWIDANDKICEILGYSLDELKQKTWVELTHPDDLDADLEKFNQVLENRIDSYSMEKRFFCKNGSLVFTKISVGCVRNSDGSVNYIVLLMEDITDRKIDEIVIRKSEERWQFALEGSGDGVWDWSIQLNEVFFSKQWKAMLGFKEDEISGNLEEWDKRIHPDDIEKVKKDIQKHIDGKTPVYENEHRIQCKDGSYKWIYSRGKIISSTEEEKPLRMIGTHSDITERKRANEELKESEDRFRFMAENTGDVLYRLQYDTMTFEYLSPAISILTGYTAKEINKIGFKSLIDQTVIPGTPDISTEELRKKRMEGTTDEWRAEYKILTKGDEEKWLGDHSFPWKDDSGKIIGSTGILQDITARKLAELELAKHHEDLEDLIKERTGEVERSQKSLVLLMEDVNEVNLELKNVNTMLDATNNELEAFSYSVSHDLRAPLTRMDGFSKALIDSHSDNLDDKAVHFLNRIRASSQHMAKLIDDLLSLSRITREKVSRQKVDLSQTAGKIAKELKASEPGRKINFEIAKGLIANADRKFVIIILENLLGNAFKFTGKKKNAIIEFGKKIIDEDEVFFIKDNGAGFNMKYYNKIFAAFQRLHSDKEYKGTGIGLAIVQRIMNKHGGKIWAESEEGKGTTFYFKFE